MTNRIDRLEERGLVLRRRSPDDRRGVLVELTPEGLERVDTAMTDLLAVEARILDALEPGGRPALAALLRTVVGQFDD
ncbi:MAG: MarR family transcriptional regulator [Cellulosimicrobium sp.]|nr:MarR family transcriptional regulator [Cellulosimicrobium sp.]